MSDRDMNRSLHMSLEAASGVACLWHVRRVAYLRHVRLEGMSHQDL